MKYYFQLQYLRLKRSIDAFGLNPYAGLALLLISFLIISQLIFFKVHRAEYVYAALTIFCVASLGERSRNDSLKIIFRKKNHRQIRLLENLFCTLPFSLMLFLEGQLLMALTMLPMTAGLALLNKNPRFMLYIPTPFGRHPYEFATGFRRSWFVILGIYLIAFFSLYYQNFNLGLVSMMMIFLVCLSFYTPFEPIFYVWIHAGSPEHFLKNKLRTALPYGLLLGLMIAIPLIIAFPAHALLILLGMLTGSLYIVLGVLAAYIRFPSQPTLSHRLQFIGAVVFPPLLLFVVPNFYFQATAKLKVYLPC